MTKVCSLHTWVKMRSKKDCENADEQEKWGEDNREKRDACEGPRGSPTAAGLVRVTDHCPPEDKLTS